MLRKLSRIDHPATIEMIASGKVDPFQFITGRIALDDTSTASTSSSTTRKKTSSSSALTAAPQDDLLVLALRAQHGWFRL